MPAVDDDAPSRLLLAAAVDAEARAILRGVGAHAIEAVSLNPWRLLRVEPSVDLLLTGVGKANAAGALARCLDPATHAVVVNLGLAGALPAQRGFACDPLDVVLASASVLADEGLASPERFQSLSAMGFAPAGADPPRADLDDAAMAQPPTAALADALSPLANRIGPIATVSTCSGEDARARELARRTGALAEAMEGAACAFAIRRLIDAGYAPPSLAFAEMRVISNTTGDRSRQNWRLREALDRLSALAVDVRERVLALLHDASPGA